MKNNETTRTDAVRREYSIRWMPLHHIDQSDAEGSLKDKIVRNTWNQTTANSQHLSI
jgi:hypothetical protein